ncbi:MAG: MarC family protein [Campylobacterales bacterium]|nr:MarC family protein [Campylobacterales bacterium]NQY54333.1 MarC family protein [Campylobacteraceae bacterium]
MELFLSSFLKIYFMMAPFFVLTVFITITKNAKVEEKRLLAIKVTFAVIVMSLVLMFFGKNIFEVFGVTLDAFRIGAGALLFLTAVDLIHGSKDGQTIEGSKILDLAVVPLAIPVTIGPGTIGILLVMGAEYEDMTQLVTGASALVSAVLLIGVMLYLSNHLEKIVGKQGLLIISKITGLFLAAISAQFVFTGIKNFMA